MMYLAYKYMFRVRLVPNSNLRIIAWYGVKTIWIRDGKLISGCCVRNEKHGHQSCGAVRFEE